MDDAKTRLALDIANEARRRAKDIAARMSENPAEDVRELADVVNGVAIAVGRIAEALQG